ncbi:HNH endonuclease signature motif containing protein [Antrihabitans cavernicola]|uniref:DUF222 domain-containing protein n=1 Tax=Antrihabitans cavernicola TaxID=2495913 RepID=A0A5A7SBX4_9NOCA|nr:HNH endonuclease signature motif containing protein [Spelaeibacter cavernicola]KAA0023640.1 DUF222 domain-containing protein [Spelaeibacter cavernicola]
MSPEECEATWQRIAEVADTVCKHDQRNRQYRLVDAFMALIHGENRLRCLCERDDCVAATTPTDKRRTPLVQISIDVATLLGLLSNPAYLEGYGPIDPALARELAKDGTWQTMLTEALEMARKLGLVDDDVEAATPEPERAQPDPEPEAPKPAAPKPPRMCSVVFHARGKRRRAGWLPEYGSTPALTDPSTAELSAEAVAELVAKAIAKDPKLANGEHPDGHGGHEKPPPGALDYRPDAETVAIVRARDRHCRFPGCRMPAKKCQVDHVIPFRHHAPHAGGWTIPSNLQCLCAFHHQLKTMKLWTAKMLPGGIIIWTSSYGTTHITLPDGGMTASPPDPDLQPKVFNGPEPWEPSEIDQGEAPF